MSWNARYWDLVEDFYWAPKLFLGFRSIGQKDWTREGGRISVPEDQVNMSGPLYSRAVRIEALKERLHASEEVLNHIFDLTFSIAADDVIREIFLRPFGFVDAGPFERIGREIGRRYGWGALENVTQPDGLYVGREAAVGVELKLRSTSWPGQVAKYVALLAHEELCSGPKTHLGLLFVVPQGAMERHWRTCGLTGPTIDRSFLRREWNRKLPTRIEKLFRQQPDLVDSVVDRLRLKVISWTTLYSQVRTIQQNLDRSSPGDETLHRLLCGLLSQLDVHRETGIPP